jgi:CheY-like chemotaxis protein
LEQLVLESLPIVRASLPSTIEIQTDLRTRTGAVLCDATQIQQVLLNLCTNAGYVMRASGGVLAIRTDRRDFRDPLPVINGILKSGRYLSLTVEDGGPGVPDDLVQRIFEPFFTTKPPGEGTGLGLSIVHTIISRHGGGITLENRRSGGARFTIHLPETVDSEAEQRRPAPPLPARGQRIAIVDDDQAISELARRTLKRHGYEAVTFASARAFLDALRETTAQFDALVTDQTMPRMTGIELIRTLRAEGRSVPALLVSGFGKDLTPAELAELAPVEFLAKPFELNALAGAVGELLKAAGDGAEAQHAEPLAPGHS